MIYFMIFCVSLVGGFAVLLLISTMCINTPIFIGLQVMMGSLRYSKDIDDKINILLGKVDADMYHVMVEQHTMVFYSKEKYPEFSSIMRYQHTPDFEIWIANKFFSYGNLYRVEGRSSHDMTGKRPSVKLIKQIYRLEQSNGVSTNKIKHDKSKAKKVVLE